MTKRFNVIVDDMEVSIKDNESELMEYPFSLGCESIDDFDPLIHECLEMVGLLNTLHQENQQLKHYKLYEDNKRLQTIIADLKEENEQLRQTIKDYEYQIKKGYADLTYEEMLEKECENDE